MVRYLGAVCKLCRREGQKLLLKGNRCQVKCPIEKKAKKPGQHGGSPSRAKSSEYSIRLREKQKAKRIAGLSEAQFFHYFKMASRMKGLAGANLIQLLARRLDNVTYMLGFAVSKKAARQLVGHGHVLVNGKKVDVPGYIVKVGDKITVSKKMSSNANIPAFQGEISTPSWLTYDKNTATGTVTALPKKEESTYADINEQYIVELYSK